MANSENKIGNVGVRLKKEERLHLEQLAIQAGAPNLSTYIRMRLFDDEMLISNETKNINEGKSRFGCDHDRELMKLMIKTFMLTREMANKTLEASTVIDCKNFADSKLKEWNYIE